LASWLVSPERSPNRVQNVRKLALALLVAHGLHDWAFGFNHRKRCLGLCVYHRHTIELSVFFVLQNPPEEIVDTILHEIAHALVGHGHGHDRVWKQKCLEIGAKPLRCGQAEMPEGKWRASCGKCGKAFHRHRKPKQMRGWHCRSCGPERGNLAWKEEG
jgi:predicted SprT family Zn-dependent metalloprotease